MTTDDMGNTCGTYQRGDLLFANKPRTVPRGTERIPQRNKGNRRATIYWSTHPQGEQNETKNIALAWIDNKKAYDMVSQSWIINCLTMLKISAEVIKFIKNTIENWRVDLTAGVKSLAEVKLQRGIFQGDALSTLLFVIAMIPLNHILRKCTGGYNLHELQEKINPLMYIDDIKLFVKKEKELETLIQAVRIYSDDIRMEFGTEIMKNRKRQMMEEIELRNQRKIRTLGEKVTYKYLGILEVDTIKQAEMKEEKIKKEIPQENEKTTRNQIT